MSRRNTTLECEGAEFLVLGNLLIQGIPAYKTYTNMAGFDLVATNPEKQRALRIQVKSRWRTRAEGFIIKRFDCEFVVVVTLNRGSNDGRREVKPPEYFVIPATILQRLPRSAWGKLTFSNIPAFATFQDAWNLIRMELGMELDYRAYEGGIAWPEAVKPNSARTQRGRGTGPPFST